MKVGDRDYRTVWMAGGVVHMIEQNRLPFAFEVHACATCADTCAAIRSMVVRGAGAIGAAAGYALAQAALAAPADGFWPALDAARAAVEATRPTARNLFHATARVHAAARAAGDPHAAAAAAVAEAERLADADAASSLAIGRHGAGLIADGAGVATHCNAGWLAFVDHGTALAPVYAAHAAGRRCTVFAAETRPRGQGARLTAWELGQAGVDHVVVPDNAVAALMSQGRVQVMIVGADRIAANGDVANKIGTLEKAIAARALGVPFYVAAPLATIDAACPDGAAIPIEERDADEVLYQTGRTRDGREETVRVCAPGSPAYNPAFDVTPARFVTGLITEHGVVPADGAAIAALLAADG